MLLKFIARPNIALTLGTNAFELEKDMPHNPACSLSLYSRHVAAPPLAHCLPALRQQGSRPLPGSCHLPAKHVMSFSHHRGPQCGNSAAKGLSTDGLQDPSQSHLSLSAQPVCQAVKKSSTHTTQPHAAHIPVATVSSFRCPDQTLVYMQTHTWQDQHLHGG
jgi:hypothetical protein